MSRIDNIKNLINPPVFLDNDKNRLAQFLNTIIISVFTASLLIAALGYFSGWTKTFLLMILVTSFTMLAYAFLRAGYLKISSILTLIFLTFGASYSLYIGYGIHDIAVIAFPIIILLASLLFEKKLFFSFQPCQFVF